MINETLRKNINVDKENILPISTFKEGDNVILKLALFKNSTEFDITGQTVRLGAKTKSGLIEQIGGFTISKNNLDIKLKNSILVAGKIEIDLEIKDTKGAMTTASFFITVNQKVLNDTAVEATNEFDTFTKTVDKIESDYTGLRRIIIDENQAASLQDQINNVNSSLDNMESKYKNIVTYDVTQLDNFDINDISKSINSITPLINSGDTLFLPSGEYITKETLNLDFKWLEGVNVRFDGSINLASEFDKSAIFIQGQQLNVYINSIKCDNDNFTGENYDVLKSNGIEIGMLFNSELKVNKIEKFNNGILLSGNKQGDTTPRGVQYSEIKCKYLFHNKTAILFKPLLDLSWINENVFRSGKIIGYDGVKCIKHAKATDTFNNNRFLYLGFEDLKNDAFNLDNTFSTLIINPRVERVGNRIIRDTSNCDRTFMLSTFTACEGNFTMLGKNSTIVGNLLSNIPNPITLSKITTDDKYNKKVYDENGLQIDTVNKSFEYTLNDKTTDKRVRSGVKIINADNTVKSVGCYVDKVIFEQTGYEFLINVTAFDSGQAISIYDKDYYNLIFDNKIINGVGVYKVINVGNSIFKAFKISDNYMRN